MAIFRLYPSKDTFITNFQYFNVAQTASNFGSSEIIEVFRLGPVSGTTTYVSGSLARGLMYFDLSPFSALTASGQAPGTATAVSWLLGMKNAQSNERLPSSFDLAVERVDTKWDE